MSLISPPLPLLGARAPRVEIFPPHERTFGPVATELCRRAGQLLDPWQSDAMDLMLSLRADGKWACYEYCEWVPRQNGKGALGEARVLAGLFVLGEKLIMWSAHEYATAMEAFLRVFDLLKALGEQVSDTLIMIGDIPIQVSNTNGKEGFKRLDTRQRVKFHARTKGAGRGFSGDVNVIDETFAYTRVQQSALMPTLRARRNPQVIYLSSPPLDGESGDVMYRLRERAESGAVNARLGYRDWGLGGDLSNLQVIDLGDRRNWAATNPAAGIRILEETFETELDAMSPEDYARELLGIWPRRVVGEGGVIDAQLWKDLTDAASSRTGDVAIGVDITPLRDHASVSLYGLRADGLGHVVTVAYGEGTDWVVGKVLELKAALDPVAIALDVKGGAGALLSELEAAGVRRPVDPEFPARGDLALPTVNEVAAGVGQFIDAARQRQLRHTGQPELSSAVSNAKTRPLADAVAWGRKQSDVDISPLVSATLARWAYLLRVDVRDRVTTLTGNLMA